MSVSIVSEDLLLQVDNLRRVVALTATSPVLSRIVEHLLKDLSAQLLRLRDDALQVPDATSPILQKCLYETPDVLDLISVCSLMSGAKIQFSREASFAGEQLRRNAIVSANGLKVRQLFVVADWLDITLDADLVFAIQALLRSRANIRVVQLNSTDDPPIDSFTIFNLEGVARAVLIQHFNAATRETTLALTIADGLLARWVEMAEHLWAKADAFDVSII
jgi:hypothetical protein